MGSISTQNLVGLPSIDGLKNLMQSLAALDAIITLDDGGYFDFRANWGKHKQVGIMNNGSGDHFFAYFNKHGCFLKGFAQESQMSPYRHNPQIMWPGLLTGVPSSFDSALKEKAFMMSDITFAIWRLYEDDAWQTDDVDYPTNSYGDGSEDMLSILDADPISYVEWASEYYETEIDSTAVRHIYAQLPLTKEIIDSLNPVATLGQLHDCLDRIGYPSN